MIEGRIEQFRKVAHELQSNYHRPPTVEEVAGYLELNTAECRSIVREFHRTTGLSWRELGVVGHPLTEERQKLRDSLDLICTPRSKIFLVSKLLEQQRLRYLSTSETRLLVYSIITGTFRYEDLDKKYSKLIGTPAKNISNQLHDSLRRSISKKSFFERLEDEIYLKASTGADRHSREYPYREFLGNVVTLLRGVTQEHPFSTLLKASSNAHGKAHIEAAQLLAPHISTILERRVDSFLILSPKHSALLRSLIESKVHQSFSTLKKFAEEQKVDQSGLLAALTGRGKYLGIIEKLEEINSRYHLLPEEEIDVLLQKVRKAKILLATEAQPILELLERSEDFQRGITESQAQCLSLLLQNALLGKRSTTKELAEKLGYTEDSVNQLLRDRSNRPGAIRWLDIQLSKLQDLPSQQIATLLYPYSTEIAHGVIQTLAELPALSPPLSRIYSLALSALDSFAQQLEPLPIIKVSTYDGKRTSPRALLRRELGQLVVGYISSAKGDVEELRRNLTSILLSKESLQISPKVAARIKRGFTTKGGTTPGAISKLCVIVNKYQDVFEQMRVRAKEENESISLSEPSSSSSIRLNTLHVAYEILTASTPNDALAITTSFCSTRPHSAYEIIRVTESLIERAGYQSLCTSLKNLENNLRHSSITIESEDFRIQFTKMLSEMPSNSGKEWEILLSCFGSSCAQRKVSIRFGALLLYTLHQSAKKDNSKIFIEEWGRICQVTPSNLSKSTVRFLRAAFMRFTELAFSPSIPSDAIMRSRFKYHALLNEVELNNSDHARNTERTHALLKEFYDKYSIAKLIQKYCFKHLQSSVRPKGLPFEDLYDIAVQAVLEATTKFNPEKYTSTGRPPPTFSTFAVNMIRWSISRHSQVHQKDRRKIVFSLNEGLGDRDDENTFLAIVADPSSKNLMDNPIEIAGVSSEELIPLLKNLLPSLRRVIELRFYVGEDIRTEGTRSLRKIAEILHSEGFTSEVISGEAVRIMLSRALRDLRYSLWQRALPNWIQYLRSPDETELPTPVILQVDKHQAHLTPEITIDLHGTTITKFVALEIDKVSDGIKGEVDVFVKALEPKSLKQVALFLISIKRGKVQACERLDG